MTGGGAGRGPRVVASPVYPGGWDQPTKQYRVPCLACITITSLRLKLSVELSLRAGLKHAVLMRQLSMQLCIVYEPRP